MIHTEKEVTVETVNDVFLESSLGYLRHILHYTDGKLFHQILLIILQVVFLILY